MTRMLFPAHTGIMASQMESEKLSARGYTRVLKIARTIADLSTTTLSKVEGSACRDIKTEHVAEAIQYRTLDRDLWA